MYKESYIGLKYIYLLIYTKLFLLHTILDKKFYFLITKNRWKWYLWRYLLPKWRKMDTSHKFIILKWKLFLNLHSCMRWVWHVLNLLIRCFRFFILILKIASEFKTFCQSGKMFDKVQLFSCFFWWGRWLCLNLELKRWI